MNGSAKLLLIGIVAGILLGIIGIVVVAIEGKPDAGALVASIVTGTAALTAILLNLRLTYEARSRAEEAAQKAFLAAEVGQHVSQVQEKNTEKLNVIGKTVANVECAHKETVKGLEEVKQELKTNGH